MFVDWREQTKLKVVSSDDQDFRNLLAGCTQSWPSALSLSLSLSLSCPKTREILSGREKHKQGKNVNVY